MRRILPFLGCLLAVAGMGQTKPYRYMPDPVLTPGVADPALTKDVICANGWSTKSVRNVPASVKAKVYRLYGYDPRGGKHPPCEIDHLISLELGGSNDIRNLWPQPYGRKHHGNPGTPWVAEVKDVLEDALHKEVCGGKTTLADAQKEISTDWVTAYKKRFGELKQ